MVYRKCMEALPDPFPIFGRGLGTRLGFKGVLDDYEDVVRGTRGDLVVF